MVRALQVFGKEARGMSDRDSRIEKMYREKQERIARQVALREARETVALSAAIQFKDPEVVADKVLKIAERYLTWIRGD